MLYFINIQDYATTQMRTAPKENITPITNTGSARKGNYAREFGSKS
jgi:hypothetical protein